MIKEEATSSRTKTLARIFLLSVVTECILVTVEMKMYINVHKPSSCIVFFFFAFLFLLFAEARPSVQFVTASLGNVVMRTTTKKKEKQTKKTRVNQCVLKTLNQKPTVIVLCSTWT